MPITQTIAKHPFITGGAIIGVGLLFILLHASGSSGTSAATGTVASSGPSDAVQIAGIQAGTALQQQQNQISQQTSQQNFQLTGQAQQLQAGLQAAQLQTQAQTSTTLSGDQQFQLGTTQLTDQTAIQGATIAAAIEQLKISTGATTQQQLNAETAQQNLATIAANNSTTLNSQNQQTQQLQISTQAQVAQGQTAAALAMQQNATATELALSQNNNATQLSFAALQASQIINGQNVAGSVATTQSNNQTAVQQNYINTTGTLAAAGLNAQATQNASILSLIQSGQLNKGGTGGANQIVALGAVTGQPNFGASAESAAAATNVSSNQFYSTLVSSLSGVAKSIFA